MVLAAKELVVVVVLSVLLYYAVWIVYREDGRYAAYIKSRTLCCYL